MLPRRKSISARFQISKIPWHGAVLVNQKTVSGPDKPVTSRKIGARTAWTLHFRCNIRAEIAGLGRWTRENSSNILWIWRFCPHGIIERFHQ